VLVPAFPPAPGARLEAGNKHRAAASISAKVEALMADVFVSYASDDRERVRPLAEALQHSGFDVCWDRSLAAGQDYAATIERDLEEAKAVIVVWTQASAASTFVRDEAGRARDDGRLVQVMLDRIAVPLGFGAFHAEDFSHWYGGSNTRQIDLLAAALKAKIEGRDIDGDALARRRRRMRTRLSIASALAVAALATAIFIGERFLF
jgi:hypothetical protein